jgi:signal peptidase I
MRRLATLALGMPVGFGVAILVTTLAPLALGYRPYTVLSGSMEPAIGTGDLIVAQPIRPIEARVGDVVTFPDPSRGGKRVTHRVRWLHASEGKAHFVTKGDANSAGERWDVPLDDRIGRVVFRIPHLGYLAAWANSPLGRWALLVVPALLLGLSQLVGLWRSRGRSRARSSGREADLHAEHGLARGRRRRGPRDRNDALVGSRPLR